MGRQRQHLLLLSAVVTAAAAAAASSIAALLARCCRLASCITTRVSVSRCRRWRRGSERVWPCVQRMAEVVDRDMQFL
jgi:hypothetical protein